MQLSFFLGKSARSRSSTRAERSHRHHPAWKTRQSGVQSISQESYPLLDLPVLWKILLFKWFKSGKSRARRKVSRCGTKMKFT